MEAEELNSGARAFFDCGTGGSWLKPGKPGERVAVALHASGAPPPPQAPAVHYRVTTHTSDTRGAGTDANVFIVLHGDRGDSERQQLEHAGVEQKDLFEQGEEDTFAVKVCQGAVQA